MGNLYLAVGNAAPESAPIPLGSQVLLGSSVGGVRRV